jgi:hypothetical protein
MSRGKPTRDARGVLDPLVLDRLLEDGRALVGPSAPEEAAATALAAAGLVRLLRDQVLRCFDGSAACAAHPTRACAEWIGVPENTRAGEDDEQHIVCPDCGFEHPASGAGRALRPRLSVRVDQDGALAWMDAAAQALDAGARRMRQGVGWRLELPEAELELVWLDRSLDSALATRAYATSRSVLYVVTASCRWSGRFRDDPWLAPLPLGTWFARGASAITEAAAAGPRPPMLCEPALRPWSPNRPAEERAWPVALGARVLEISAQGATLDGIEVLRADAPAALAMLRALALRWREDVGDGKAAADHCFYTPDEIAEMAGLVVRGEAARKQVARLRAGVVERYAAATGVRLAEGAVIENSVGVGYRVGAAGVVVRVV